MYEKNRSFVEDRIIKAGGGENLEDFSSFPRYFQLETINDCTARCIMCGIKEWKKLTKQKLMSDSLFKKIADEIIEHKQEVQSIALYVGNEPLMDENITNRINYLAKNNICINISTNASLLNKDKAKALIDCGINHISFSIDSLNKKIYEEIRRGLNFEKVLGNILAFIKMRDSLNANIKIKINIVENSQNTNEIANFVEFWEKILDKNKGDFVRVESFVQTFNQKQNMQELENKAQEEYEKINALPCYTLWNTMVIKADGSVALCCIDQLRNYCSGNLENNSIQEIWHNHAKAIKELHLKAGRGACKICKNCACWL